uniref:dUTPase-like domain-containing protein n=1 Tax=viral metagenome TaxID=1070528 RepID=A0A6C0DV93_9ZZZZ
MGSVMSYYLHSASLQSAIDYMTSYDSIGYYDNDATTDTDVNANANANANDTYYKLFIYVHDTPGMDSIKELYKTNALKHNSVVDGYLNACANADEDVCYDSGFDLLCPEDNVWSKDLPVYMLDFNISCSMTYNNKLVGYYLYLRSSTPIRTPLRLANNVGIIDSGYRGTIKAPFDYNILYSTCETFEFVKTNRYVQLTPPNIGYPMKVFIVDDLSMLGKKNNRNENGFGSSGN